jgi:hypothetical protein
MDYSDGNFIRGAVIGIALSAVLWLVLFWIIRYAY